MLSRFARSYSDASYPCPRLTKHLVASGVAAALALSASAARADEPKEMQVELSIAPALTFGTYGYSGLENSGVYAPGVTPPPRQHLSLHQTAVALGGSFAARFRHPLDDDHALGLEARLGAGVYMGGFSRLPNSEFKAELDIRALVFYDAKLTGEHLRWTAGAGVLHMAFAGSQEDVLTYDNVVSFKPLTGPAAMFGVIYDSAPNETHAKVMGVRVHGAYLPGGSESYVPITFTFDYGWRF